VLKEEIIKKYQINEKDTGSPEIQIGLITEKIKKLILHLREHKKDIPAKRSLLRMISKRKKLLKYLKVRSLKRYEDFIEKHKL